MCVCVCVRARVHVYVYACVCVHVYACMRACVCFMCMRAGMRLYMCVLGLGDIEIMHCNYCSKDIAIIAILH